MDKFEWWIVALGCHMRELSVRQKKEGNNDLFNLLSPVTACYPVLIAFYSFFSLLWLVDFPAVVVLKVNG